MSGQNDTLYISLRLPLTRQELDDFNKLVESHGAKKGPFIRQLILKELSSSPSGSHNNLGKAVSPEGELSSIQGAV